MRSRIIGLVCLCLAAPIVLYHYVERAAVAAFRWLSPRVAEAPDFAFEDRQVAYAGDFPVDAAVSHSLRHEAGMRRLN